MTYLQFLIVFLIIPLVFMGVAFKKSNIPHKKEFFWGILTLVLLAVTYTTPWDNYLVATKVWWYGEDRVIGTIGYVPIEEYMFFVLQTLFTGLFCFFLQKVIPLKMDGGNSSLKSVITVIYCGFFLLGVYSLTVTSMKYLGLILTWAIPILILQWVIGAQHLIKNAKIFLITFIAPSAYLWIADALAIKWNIWAISEKFTIGIKFGTLPLEEAVFFLVTNLMVAQGLILFIVMEEEVAKVLKFKKEIFS
jgi:lycopene cyclase domain-containing protein